MFCLGPPIVLRLKPYVPVRFSKSGGYSQNATAFFAKKRQKFWSLLTVESETKNRFKFCFKRQKSEVSQKCWSTLGFFEAYFE